MGVVRQITTAVMLAIALISQREAEPPLESLPTGEYFYENSSSSNFVLLRKAGRIVVGLDAQSRACFRGFLEGDRITNTIRVYPPYQPDSRLEHQAGVMLDLAQYDRVELQSAQDQVEAAIVERPSLDQRMREFDRETLQTCLQFFAE